MKINSAIFSFLILALCSCKENKPVTAKQNPNTESKAETILTGDAVGIDENKTISSESSDSIMKFIISFYSIGAGIDRGQTEKLLSFIESFEKKYNLIISYSKIHWGREGETDYCFPFRGVTESTVSDFKKGVKEALKTAEHVHFIENQACRKGR